MNEWMSLFWHLANRRWSYNEWIQNVDKKGFCHFCGHLRTKFQQYLTISGWVIIDEAHFSLVFRGRGNIFPSNSRILDRTTPNFGTTQEIHRSSLSATNICDKLFQFWTGASQTWLGGRKSRRNFEIFHSLCKVVLKIDTPTPVRYGLVVKG